jgi:hypothetical protein
MPMDLTQQTQFRKQLMRGQELCAQFAHQDGACKNLYQFLKEVRCSKYHEWCLKDRQELLRQLKGPLDRLSGPKVQYPVR